MRERLIVWRACWISLEDIPRGMRLLLILGATPFSVGETLGETL